MTFLTMASSSPGATREAPPPPPLRPPPPGVGAELRGQEAGTNNQVKMRWKSLERSHLFLKNKQQKTRRPSAGCEDTEARTTLLASHSQGHRPTCCPRGPSTGPTARGSPRRSGRPGSALLQPPRSETQANPRPLRSGHWALPYQAGLLDEGWRRARTLVTMGTLLSGKQGRWLGPQFLECGGGGHVTFVPNTQLSPQVNQDYNHNSKKRIVLFFILFFSLKE